MYFLICRGFADWLLFFVCIGKWVQSSISVKPDIAFSLGFGWADRRNVLPDAALSGILLDSIWRSVKKTNSISVHKPLSKGFRNPLMDGARKVIVFRSQHPRGVCLLGFTCSWSTAAGGAAVPRGSWLPMAQSKMLKGSSSRLSDCPAVWPHLNNEPFNAVLNCWR